METVISSRFSFLLFPYLMSEKLLYIPCRTAFVRKMYSVNKMYVIKHAYFLRTTAYKIRTKYISLQRRDRKTM